MAYAKIYTYEFTDFPTHESGLSQWLWRVSFLRNGYTGSLVTVQPADNPLTIEIDGQTDSRYSGFLSEKYTFDLLCDDKLQASALYVKSDDEVQILIEVDKTNTGSSYQTYRTGWLMASELKEAYSPKPYPVTVSAICGLTRLKTRAFLDENGKRLTGYVRLSHAIRLCLFQTGIAASLSIASNLYALADMADNLLVDGHADPALCPWYNTQLSAQWFLTDSNSTRMAADVLQEFLKTGHRLKQDEGGMWWMVRCDEPAGGWDVANIGGTTTHYRTYTSSVLSDAPTENGSVDFNVYTDPAGALNVGGDGSAYTWKGVTKPGVRLEQAYGRYFSRFLAGFDAVDSTGLPVGYTTNNLLTGNRYVTGAGTDIDPERLVIWDAGDNYFTNTTPYVKVRVDYGTSSDQFNHFYKRTWKGRARLTNCRAAKMAFIAERDDNPYFFVPAADGGGTSGQWTALSKLKSGDMRGALQYNDFTDLTTHHVVNAEGYFDFSIDLGTLDKVKALVIYYCMAEALDHYDPVTQHIAGPELGQTNGIRPKVEYLPGELIEEIQDQQLDGIQRTIVTPGKVVTDTDLSLTLGDVPSGAHAYDRIDTLITRGFTLSTLWFRPDADMTASPTQGKPLLHWLSESYAAQLMTGPDKVDATLIGRPAFGGHAVVHFYGVGSPTYPHQCTRYSYAVRDCQIAYSGERIMPAIDLSTFRRFSEWQTPNGTIPISTDGDGEPVVPTVNTPLSDRDELLGQLVSLGQGPTLGAVLHIPGTVHGIPVGGAVLGANVYNHGIIISTIQAEIQKKIDLTHHL